ncbi:nuclease domain-containing protein [Terasakiella pusilla]|uniref:nuclease domain-containing protein n=1 Tax=Terasakiella pusilla TaxID=64973 RepID=UPI003AA99C5D
MTKTTPVRKSARNKPCALRLPCCNGNPETTVLAHIRRFGWAGIAQKPNDLLSLYACSSCHDVMDGRAKGECTDTDVLRAHGETLQTLIREGLVVVKGAKQ